MCKLLAKMDVVAGPSRSSEHESQLEKPSCGPSSFTELKKLKMDALRGLCKSCSIPFSCRVTKQDLLELGVNFLGFPLPEDTKVEKVVLKSLLSLWRLDKLTQICLHLHALLLAGQFLICAKSLISPWRMCMNIC